MTWMSNNPVRLNYMGAAFCAVMAVAFFIIFGAEAMPAVGLMGAFAFVNMCCATVLAARQRQATGDDERALS